MPKALINGLNIAYEIIGDGDKPASITPGGRFSKDTPGVRQLAQELAKEGYRTVIWDRPNCGESDICFTGENESALAAECLAGLLKHLKMTPALIIGGSAGQRHSLTAISRHPGIVRKYAGLWLTAGSVGLANLVGVYCGGLERAVHENGMEAALKDWTLIECLERNPGNRERLLSYDRETFLRTMQEWGWHFFPKEGSLIPGLLPSDFKKFTMPALIFLPQHSDSAHLRRYSEDLAKLLVNSQTAELPFEPDDWRHRIEEGGKALFQSWYKLAPQIVAFDKTTA